LKRAAGGCTAGERAVIADVHPGSAPIGLALGQHRHRRVVTVQALGRQHMGLDQRVQRCERDGAGTHLVGQRRQAELDGLTGVAILHPVSRRLELI
jgi:hypothetical protein